MTPINKPMEWWIEMASKQKEYDAIHTWRAWSEPLHEGLGVHVREVVELTAEEKRRVGQIGTWARTHGHHPDVDFLLSLLERAGVIG